MVSEARGISPVTFAFTANDQNSDSMPMRKGEVASLSLDGTFVCTVRVQRQFAGQSTWQDVPDASGGHLDATDSQKSYVADERCLIRLATGAADFTSGTANGRIGKG